MVDFKLEGVDKPVSLPDEYLTVRQWEDVLRFFVKQGLEEVDFTDMAILRQIAGVMLPEGVDLGDIPMTKTNFQTLVKLYEHVGKLVGNAMTFGDEVIEEAVKKDHAPKAPRSRKKKKQVSNDS